MLCGHHLTSEERAENGSKMEQAMSISAHVPSPPSSSSSSREKVTPVGTKKRRRRSKKGEGLPKKLKAAESAQLGSLGGESGDANSEGLEVTPAGTKKRRRKSRKGDGLRKKLKAAESAQLCSPPGGGSDAHSEGLDVPPSPGEGQPDEAQAIATADGVGDDGTMASSPVPVAPFTDDNANMIDAAVPPLPAPKDPIQVMLKARFQQISEWCLSLDEDIQTEGMKSLMLDPNLSVLLPGLIIFTKAGIVWSEANQDLYNLFRFVKMVGSISVNETLRLDPRLGEFIPCVRNCILTPDLCGSHVSIPLEIQWQVRVFAARVLAQLCQRTLAPNDMIRKQRDIFNSLLLCPRTPVGTLHGAIAGLGELGNEVVRTDLLPKILVVAGRVEASLSLAHSPVVHTEGSLAIIELIVNILGPILKSTNGTPKIEEYRKEFGIFGEFLLKAVALLREEDERIQNYADALAFYTVLTRTTPPVAGLPVLGKTLAIKAEQPNNPEGYISSVDVSTSTSAEATVTPSPISSLLPNVVVMTEGTTPATATPTKNEPETKTLTPAKEDSASLAQDNNESDEQSQSVEASQSTMDGLIKVVIKIKEEQDRDENRNGNGEGE